MFIADTYTNKNEHSKWIIGILILKYKASLAVSLEKSQHRFCGKSVYEVCPKHSVTLQSV